MIFLEFFSNMFSVMLIAIFLENSLFSRALGTSTALLIIRKRFDVVVFGLTLTSITTISSIVAFFVNPLIPKVFVPYLNQTYNITPLVYVLIIGLVYILLLILSAIFIPKEFDKSIKPMIHLSAFNCAVFGALLLSTQSLYSLSGFVGFGLGTGIGFMVAVYFISVKHSHLNSKNISKAFRGFPITLIYIGIISLAFYGLTGHKLPF